MFGWIRRWPLWWLAWAGVFGARAADSPAARDAEATAFFAGPVLAWEVILPPESLAQLRRSPREFVSGTVRVGGREFRGVGVHVKGSAGSTRNVDDRPALTLKFNRFHKGQRVFGCEKLHLNNSVQDGSLLHENLASRVYLDVGIPTTRATHGMVRFNGRDLGIYVVKEAFDDDFVRRNFPADGDHPGNLYEGGFLGDVNRNLQKDAGRGPDDRSDLLRLRAALRVPLEQRWAALTNVLDVERFLTLTAIQLTLDDWDGYVRNRNNYRLYFGGRDGRAVFLPHGMDQLLIHSEAPVRDVWAGLVAQAMFELPAQRIRLRERMRELVSDRLSEGRLTNELAQIQARLEAAVSDRTVEERNRVWPDSWSTPGRIRQRLEVVRRELAAWPDPLPPWAPGRTLTPSGWTVLVQSGNAQCETNVASAGVGRTFHLRVEQPETRASFRSVVNLPAGRYRFSGQARTRGLEAFEDQFGRGAALRVTGATATAHLEGGHGWTGLDYDLFQPDDGPVELIIEVRANAGEAWFDADTIRVEGR